MTETPALVARRIVGTVLVENLAHDDPAVRAAAEAELLERHASVAVAMRRAGESYRRQVVEVGRILSNAVRPLAEFVAGFTGAGEP